MADDEPAKDPEPSTESTNPPESPDSPSTDPQISDIKPQVSESPAPPPETPPVLAEEPPQVSELPTPEAPSPVIDPATYQQPVTDSQASNIKPQVSDIPPPPEPTSQTSDIKPQVLEQPPAPTPPAPEPLPAPPKPEPTPQASDIKPQISEPPPAPDPPSTTYQPPPTIDADVVHSLTDEQLKLAAALYAKKNQSVLSRKGVEARQAVAQKNIADILAFVRAHSPANNRTIARALNLPPRRVQHYMQLLTHRGDVVATGWGLSREYRIK
jgi:hypothetical protein